MTTLHNVNCKENTIHGHYNLMTITFSSVTFSNMKIEGKVTKWLVNPSCAGRHVTKIKKKLAELYVVGFAYSFKTGVSLLS